MKITDVIVSAILKKGVLSDIRNVDTDIEIPLIVENQERRITIHIKCEHITMRIMRNEEIEA